KEDEEARQHWKDLHDEIAADDPDVEGWDSDSIEAEVDDLIESTVLEQLQRERSFFFTEQLLRNGRPIEVQLPTTAIFPPIVRPFLSNADEIHYYHLSLHHSSTSPTQSLSDLHSWIEAAQKRVGGVAPSVVLEGFPSSLLFEFALWIRVAKKTVLGTLAAGKEGILRRTSTWSWELEDGSLFSIDSPVSVRFF
ncbi:hypothetical protein BDY24DRAFT_385955, partial [Mrakia frigida]|uniref:uncharacterized protein n=1 Tax=Mrakia frigida TaxID=29902 RepID=UPI003FCBF176